MLRTKLFLACAVTILVSFPTGTAVAQEPRDQRTYFTFSQPIALPGVTLPAGTYLFRLADMNDRHIVQVLTQDGMKIYKTLLAIPAQRLDTTSKPEVRFMEVAADMPNAIKTWWYPNRSFGHEFIYPKEQARLLAGATKGSVLTVATDADTAEEMRTAELTRISPTGEETQVAAASTPEEVSGTAFEGQIVSSETTPVTQESRVARAEPRTELPGTASWLPLVGLIGLGSLAGAASLRVRRRSRS